MNKFGYFLSAVCGLLFLFFVFYWLAEFRLEIAFLCAIGAYHLITFNRASLFLERKDINSSNNRWLVFKLIFLFFSYGLYVFMLWLIKQNFK